VRIWTPLQASVAQLRSFQDIQRESSKCAEDEQLDQGLHAGSAGEEQWLNRAVVFSFGEYEFNASASDKDSYDSEQRQ
jgi:hypothetical protein